MQLNRHNQNENKNSEVVTCSEKQAMWHKHIKPKIQVIQHYETQH